MLRLILGDHSIQMEIVEVRARSNARRSSLMSFHLVGNPFANLVAAPVRFLPHPLVASAPVANNVDFESKPESTISSPRFAGYKKGRKGKQSIRRDSVNSAVDTKWLPSEESAGEETTGEFAVAPIFGPWGPDEDTEIAAFEPSVSTLASGFSGGPFPGFTGFSQPSTTADAVTSGGTKRSQLEADALSALAKLGYVGLTVDDLGKLNPPDEYEEELNVMAEVRAYFQVAYKVRGALGAANVVTHPSFCSVSSTIYRLPSTICSCSPSVKPCSRT